MNTFKEYDVVRLRVDKPGLNLLSGTRGTVLMVFVDHDGNSVYEIEFVDDENWGFMTGEVNENELERDWG